MKSVKQFSTEELSIDKVWEKYLKSRNNGNGTLYKNLLIEHYRDLTKYSAERLHATLPPYVELDDLISDGVFGLMDAIEHFSPKRHIKFETYCSVRIKGTMLDGLRNRDYAARVVRTRHSQTEKAKSYLRTTTGREPNEQEILRELKNEKYNDTASKLSAKKAHKKVNHTKKAKLILNDGNTLKTQIPLYVKKKDDQMQEEYEENPNFIEDSNPPYLRAENKELKDALLNGLTRAEKLIVVLYYCDEMTMKEIGAVLELSESRVSQTHSSILTRLKSKLTGKSRRSRELLEDLVTA